MADQGPLAGSQLSLIGWDVLSHRGTYLEGNKKQIEAITGRLDNRLRKHFKALNRQRALCELRVVVAGDHGDGQTFGMRIRVGLLELGVVLLGLVEQIASDDQPIDIELTALLENVLKRGESLRVILLRRQVQVSCDGYAQEDP
jgi:hypothetical protein